VEVPGGSPRPYGLEALLQLDTLYLLARTSQKLDRD
jgi:hypothetical protein